MIRLYGALLRLYPASFRGAYEEEMRAVFGRRLAATRGPAARVRLLVGEALADVVPNALALHAEMLAQDLRHAGRSLARSPAFAVTAVAVVALGVGANTAAFSVADFVLVRPLPFHEPDRLVRVWERTPGYSRMELSPANYRDWKETSGSFEAMAAYHRTAVNLTGVGEPRRLEAARVERDLFAVLGVEPILGRTFASGDGREERSVVLGYGLWRSEFGGRRDALGRSVSLDGTPYRVVGVMPERVRFPSRATRLWIPLDLREGDFLDRNDNYLEALGRLAAGIPLERAAAELDAAAARLTAEYPGTNAQTGASLHLLRDDVPERAKLLLLALAGATLCVLLLACSNLTNLLLARSAARERELAVRAALGAGRERLVRQMVTESAVLSALGGFAGVLLAAGAVPLLARLVPTTLPIAERPGLDVRLLGTAALFTALTAGGFGVLPAIRAAGHGGLDALRAGGRGGVRGQRLRATLVSVQVAATVVLLACAGLLVRAAWRLLATDPGFRTEDVLAVRTALPWPRYAGTARRDDFYSRVLEGVRGLPGVSGAAYTTGVPLVMTGGIWPVTDAGAGELVRDASNTASLRFVTPGYFDVLGVPLLQGREVAEGDTFDAPWVAVVSESFAHRYWPGEDPLGKRFELAFAERTVVGVVAEVRVRGLDRASEPQVYLPHRQVPDGSLIAYPPKDLVVRSSLPPGAVLPGIRSVVAAVDPEQPLSGARTLADVVAGEAASRLAQLRVLGALAAVALLLAAVGMHGLLAFTVSARRREIGVRMALGAAAGGIGRMVLAEGAALALLGIVPGVLAALAAGRALDSLLLGVRPWDPAVLSAAVGLVLAIAAAGSVAPALRAARVSPASAMMAE